MDNGCGSMDGGVEMRTMEVGCGWWDRNGDDGSGSMDSEIEMIEM